jgi:hypothetical protein
MGDHQGLGRQSIRDSDPDHVGDTGNIPDRSGIMMLFPNTNPYSGKLEKVKNLRNWMIDAATILFDDSKNDLRALPKTVRLQILLTLSFLWSTAFTIYIWGIRTDLWLSWFLGHMAVIFVAYYTFKQFHKKPYTMKPDQQEPPMYDDVWGA